MTRKTAEALSYLLSNPVVGGLGGLVVMLREEAFLDNPALNILTVLLFYSIVPFVSVYYLRLRGKSDVFMSEKSRRQKHFIPGLVGYAVSAIVFQGWGMKLMGTVSSSFLLTSLILLLLTFATKVSIHVAGLTATVILILYSYWPTGLILLPLIPVLAWARVSTGEHTCWQTVLGVFSGTVGGLLGIAFFPPWY
ncbi:MAG: hypothetical protein FGF50_11380 [Candidatus Brockarchaeota archaeon]|nr:hypothetical protein [Candidatus Brockarchaeota archaeon]